MKERVYDALIAGLHDRRFILALGAGVMTDVLVYLGKLTSSSHDVVTVAVVAAYITGHVFGVKKAAE